MERVEAPTGPSPCLARGPLATRRDARASATTRNAIRAPIRLPKSGRRRGEDRDPYANVLASRVAPPAPWVRGTSPFIRILGRRRARDCSVPFGGRGDLTPFRMFYRSDPIPSALGASVLADLSLGEVEGRITAVALDNLSYPESGFFSVPHAVVAMVCYARSTD